MEVRAFTKRCQKSSKKCSPKKMSYFWVGHRSNSGEFENKVEKKLKNLFFFGKHGGWMDKFLRGLNFEEDTVFDH